jgi:hypothetical protein
MQMTQQEESPDKPSVFFLPMIGMNAKHLSRVYSTLLFVCKETGRYQRTPILTFDQPLFWKAMVIVWNEPIDSKLRSMVIRLGAFHTEMSFLGCIGHIMEGSVLQEMLEIIYATNTVPHILNGRAIARAIGGHFLIDTSLHCLLQSEVFGFPFPSFSEYQDLGKQTSLDFENSQILKDASELYAQLLDRTTSEELIRNHSVFRQWQISFQEILNHNRKTGLLDCGYNIQK